MPFFFFLKMLLFILERAQGPAGPQQAQGRGGGWRERMQSRLGAQGRAMQGRISRPGHRDLGRSRESGAQPSEPPRHPPTFFFF